MARPSAQMIGTTIGHYRIVSLLGSGGMGEVYLAEDTRLGREVALKTLPSLLASNDEFRERLEREAKAVAAINHPNIVTIHSVEDRDGVRFITMELVRGKSLAELIPPAGLPLNRVLDVAVPLADAVASAHQRGITHRDLKPVEQPLRISPIIRSSSRAADVRGAYPTIRSPVS